MLKSLGWRFFTLGALILLMTVPVMFVGDIIEARADYNRSTQSSVAEEWGGPQSISGPLLKIPVQETVTVREQRAVLDEETGVQTLDAQGKPVFRSVEVQKTLNRAPVYLYPGQFDVTLDTITEERARGIFRVPVYSTQARFAFDFPISEAEALLIGDETMIWDRAELLVDLTSNRALRGEAQLDADGQVIEIEPQAVPDGNAGGVRAPLGDPRGKTAYNLSLHFKGAQKLFVAPVGRTSRITLTSDWPDPSFRGAFLPDMHDITAQGFSAVWTIPHLARPLAQVSRENQVGIARQSSFGVAFYQPNDFYQRSYRAARYGILFIGLTFLTIFLIEGQAKRPTHPVQYVLVGLAQSVFFLLMLALAEQVGFATAYVISSFATVALITAFARSALLLGKRAWLLGGVLALLYGVLFLILRSADFALLAGSILAFTAIAGTMFATRNENWYATSTRPGERRSWFSRRPPSPLPPDGAPPKTA